MDIKENNYEIRKLKGEYDLSYSYGYSNDDEGSNVTIPDNIIENFTYFHRYKYVIETFSFRGFMKEYVIIVSTNIDTQRYNCCIGYKNEATGKIFDIKVTFKDSILYIDDDKFMDSESSIIIRSMYKNIIKIVSYENKPKPYKGTGEVSTSTESMHIVCGYFNKECKLNIESDIKKLRRLSNIIETFDYYNFNILINHSVENQRGIIIGENPDDKDSIIQYIITNRDIVKMKAGTLKVIEDNSYIQFMEGVLYIFLDNDNIKDRIEIIDGFRDKIVIERAPKLSEVF